MLKIKVGILGAAGYTGGELLRLLVNHPNVDLVFVHSNSQAGKKISAVHTDLLGDTIVCFTNQIQLDIDVVFLCVGHGDAKKLLEKYSFPNTVKIIDLSQDHRIHSTENSEFVYGLPELNREKIKQSSFIANPGCFASAIQLALLPLMEKKWIKSDIQINATTGSTGAGQSLSETSHFTWRTSNLSVYKAFEHQHLKEIGQTVKGFDGSFPHEIVFIPQRGAFSRGILASLTMKVDKNQEELMNCFESYYRSHPFVHLSRQAIDLKQVVNTNKCVLYLEKNGDRLLIVSIIDNLLKGASGQAVQNMNLLFGLEETTGLKLKAIAF